MHRYWHYPDAFLVGTRELTFEETGFYIVLIDLYYSRDGILPDDDIANARHLQCDLRMFRRLKDRLLAKRKARIVDGYIHVNRGDKTISQQRANSIQQRDRVNARWQKQKTLNNTKRNLNLGQKCPGSLVGTNPKAEQNQSYPLYGSVLPSKKERSRSPLPYLDAARATTPVEKKASGLSDEAPGGISEPKPNRRRNGKLEASPELQAVVKRKQWSD